MKTIKRIEVETEECRKAMRDADSSRQKTLNGKLLFLKQCKMYLETEPSEEYLKKEKLSLELKINAIEERFGSWTAGRSGGQTELLSKYHSESGYNNLRVQLKTLKYLLDE